MKQTAIAGAIAVAAALALAPGAVADDDYTPEEFARDLEWVTHLESIGIYIADLHEAGRLGTSVCYLVDTAAPLEDIDALIQHQIVNTTPPQVIAIRTSAIRTYCPPPDATLR